MPKGTKSPEKKAFEDALKAYVDSQKKTIKLADIKKAIKEITDKAVLFDIQKVVYNQLQHEVTGNKKSRGGKTADEDTGKTDKKK